MAIDMDHVGLRRDRLHHLGMNSAIPHQQSKNDAFTPSVLVSLRLTSTPKVGLIHLNLTRELGTFQFCRMKEHHPQSLIHPGNGLGIQAQISNQLIGWLLLIKALQDGKPAAELSQTFFCLPQSMHLT
jgi:hypothetical protein